MVLVKQAQEGDHVETATLVKRVAAACCSRPPQHERKLSVPCLDCESILGHDLELVEQGLVHHDPQDADQQEEAGLVGPFADGLGGGQDKDLGDASHQTKGAGVKAVVAEECG